MNKAQRDLLAACWNKRMKADYVSVQTYATQFRKYDYLTMREIDEVIEKMKELGSKI